MVDHTAALSAVATVSGSLSILGSAFIIASLLRRSEALDRPDQLLIILSTIDICVSFSFTLNRAFLPGPGESPGALCYAQAIGIQFFGVAGIIWTAIMSFSLVFSIRPGGQSSLFETRGGIARLVVATGVASGAIAAAAIPHHAGNATLWCWIKASSERGAVQLGAFYAPLLLAWATCIINTVRARRLLHVRLKETLAKPQQSRISASDDYRQQAGGSRVRV